jgi:hypothetical protein
MRKVVFIADMFVDEYVGGAELSTQCLIDCSPYEVIKIKSKDLTKEDIEKHRNEYWVFTNFFYMRQGLIPQIIAKLEYSIVEYDFKYCFYRSPDLHEQAEGYPCKCHNFMLDQFYGMAKTVFYMSERQAQWFENRMPEVRNAYILSSLFDDKTLDNIKILKKETRKDSWAIIYSNSKIKGFDAAVKYCEEKKLSYHVLRDLEYEKLLSELSNFHGFVYLPIGGDTCPRTVIEAKLLGLELILNDNVLHKDEAWFKRDNIDFYLRKNKKFFWQRIKRHAEKVDLQMSDV